MISLYQSLYVIFMNWFFIIAVLASLGIALYLGFRTINLFNLHQQGYFNTTSKKIFWLLIMAGSSTFIVSRSLNFMSDYWFPLIGNIIFSLIICFFYSMIIIDCCRVVGRIIFKKASRPSYGLQTTYILIAGIMFVVGLYMASSPRIVDYQIDINKIAKVDKLKIVQVSDIHISETTSIHFIQTMVDDVNRLKPDYIFITGDTLDLRLKPYLDKNLAAFFSKLHATYGTFIIMGNHEYYGIEREENNSLDAVVSAFEASNMKVLRDTVFYDPRTGITIIGRDDYVVKNFNKTRAELSALTHLVEHNTPVILLDHQPKNIIEPASLGVDVMFSGHTHAGQIFPITLLVKLMYKNPWGIDKPVQNNPFTSIVSSGYGLWGPPIRLMTRAELVVTELNFKQPVDDSSGQAQE